MFSRVIHAVRTKNRPNYYPVLILILVFLPDTTDPKYEKIIVTAIGDNRPVKDIVFTHESYLDVYKQAGLEIVKMYKPLAKESEPYNWINETKINPWVIYILKNIG